MDPSPGNKKSDMTYRPFCDFAIQNAGNGVIPGQCAGQTGHLIGGAPPE